MKFKVGDLIQNIKTKQIYYDGEVGILEVEKYDLFLVVASKEPKYTNLYDIQKGLFATEFSEYNMNDFDFVEETGV